MKKPKKIVLAAVLSIVFGVTLFVVGMGINKWDFNKLDATEYKAKSFAAKNDERIERIDIDVRSFPIVVKAGEGVSLDYFEATDSDVSVSVADGTLKVVERYKFNPFKTGLFHFLRSSHKFVLTVAENTDVAISGTNCDLEVSGASFAAFNVNITNLDAEFTDCTFGSLAVVSTNLDMTCTRCTAQSMTVQATNTDAAIADCDIPAITLGATNADVDISRTQSKTIELKSTNGDYDLRAVSVDDLSVRAVNLDADIEIRGERSEYTVRSDGRGLPPGQTGSTDKVLSFSGTNCDCRLSFV